jgi:ribosome-associated protein
MIEITPTLHIPEPEVKIDFVRASGPGGQNVNKVATAAQLRFDVLRSPSLPEEVKTRLVKLAGKRLTSDGILVIDARRYRSQERNRQDAVDRLVNLVQKALAAPSPRRPTKPGPAARQQRLEEKKRRSEIKRSRQSVDW